jgi:response regulator of citrate/malate metabolism
MITLENSNHKYVLIVEDDTSIEKRLRHIIRQIDPNLNCVWATESAIALNLMKQNLITPEFILIDIFLPGKVDGVGLWEKLLSYKYYPPIVFMSNLSAWGYSKVMRKKSKQPPFLEKPLKLTDARRKLREVYQNTKS